MTLDDHYFPMADEEDPVNESVNMVTATPKAKYNGEAQVVRHVRYVKKTLYFYLVLIKSLKPMYNLKIFVVS